MINNNFSIMNILLILALTAVTLVIGISSGRSSSTENGGGSEYGSGGEGSESGEESGTRLTLNETYNMVRSGARLIMSYDAQSNSFIGTVENTTNSTLKRVRVEAHLSNGVELGPTTPTDLAPGQKIDIALQATTQAFNGWSAHPEVGSGEGGHGGESGGEHGNGGEGNEGSESGEHGRGGELGEGSREDNEAAMSSPITPLGQSWSGVLGELAVSMQYDIPTKSVYGTVKNISTQTLCYVQAEPHLKLGTRTVAELGPEKLGELNLGQQVNSRLSVNSEPNLAEVVFDGYVIHMEVFDCNSSGPIPHAGGEGGEGSREGSGEGGEHGSISESSGEHGNSGESNESGEESGTRFTLNETYDRFGKGTRLVMFYDAQNNSFIGTVENTTNKTLKRVRVEVHLSNGIELGPTTPTDLAPNQKMSIKLRATDQVFNGWTPHAEVGNDEHGSSREASDEYGGVREASGEHGGGREFGGN